MAAMATSALLEIDHRWYTAADKTAHPATFEAEEEVGTCSCASTPRLNTFTPILGDVYRIAYPATPHPP